VTPQSKFDERIYVARLTPHRSLTPAAVRRLLAFFCLANVVYAAPFIAMGAWPVAGFVGLDILGLYIAFSISFRRARNYETLELTPVELVLVKVAANGERAEWRFNPSWVRLEQEAHVELGAQRVALASRGRSVEIGSFLGPEQKAELARDLGRALARARQGVSFA
jgi:uncharacterized membrane protein